MNRQINNTVEHVTLHTAEDTKTLIRTFATIAMQNTASAGVIVMRWLLSVWPNSQQVALLTGTAEDLDNPVPVQEIARGCALLEQDTAGFLIEVDIKAMRKLKENDKIALSLITSSGTDTSFRAEISQWFKE